MRRRDERGAIALVTAAVMVVLLGVAAFVVDIGMQRVARQDLQALADVVALDLARMLDGRTAGEIEAGEPGPSLAEATDASKARNDDDTVGEAEALKVMATLLVPQDDGEGWRTADPEEEPEAVRVETSTTVDFGFAGAIGFGSGGAARTSIASARSSACFHLGSYAAAIERDAGLLDPLNDVLALDLTLLGYRALAAADVSLDDLADQPSIGSASALLDGPLTLDELIAAVKVVLRAQPGGNAAAVAALDSIAAGTDGGLQVKLREVLVVADDDVDALRTDINVLDLMGPAILDATGTRPLETGFLPLETPVLEVEGGVQRACSSGLFQAATLRLEAEGSVDLLDPQAPDRLRDFDVAAAEVSVRLGIGGAEFSLADSVECRTTSTGTDRYQVDVTGGLSTLDLEAVVTVAGNVPKADLPDDVTAITFDASLDLGEEPGPLDVVTSAELEVPRNAVNGRPVRGVPVGTGADVAAFDAIRAIGRRELLGQVVIVTDPEAEDPVAARRRGRLFVRDVRLTLDQAIDAQVEAEVGDAVEQWVAPLATVLGARRQGGDVFSEDRPTCIGISLVG